MGYIGRESRGEWFDKVSRHIDEMNVLRKRYGSKRGLESVTQYKIELIEKTIRELEGRLEMLMGELREAELEASKYGERIYSGRGQHEIIADIRELRGKLESYRDIDDSIEATYNYYKGLYNELRKKLEKIRNDRLLAEKELSKRVSLWRVRIEEYIDRVSRIYNSILSRLNAEGYARVVNIDDVNEAGLHLFVGFGGLEPTVLDVYSQSGGERTTAAMAFLLALQQFVKSPFRAIDEFDVHMDPRNREIVLEYVVEMMRGRRDQYILITPGYISRELGDANIIVVQKIEGVTVPKVIGGSELVE
jgi:chromosome segregation protein